ncbi:lysophospholipid acyltransferase family protein [Piscinibacter sakaiensis]|uniref:lysophospholipid acyltransferase family protein n=1 Tax=Piscinibacter sakaiensis TaxID=1547922 RepID=UPI003AAF24AC
MLKLFRWMSRWPLRWLHALGTALGWLAYGLSPTYRRRFAAHVEQVGIGKAAARSAVASAGRMVAELPRLWLGGAASVPWRCVGDELVRAALDNGKGLLLLTPHLGCFEITAQVYAINHGAEHPITVMYRPARQAWLRDVMAGSRDRPGMTAVPAELSGVRQMMRALKRGDCVGLLPDQVPPEGMGVWAPFFGRDAYTMTLAARLAQQSGAVVLLTWGERLPDGAGYVVHYEPLPEALPADADAQAESAAVVNRAMQQLILRCPGQYLWGYHRYKAPRTLAASGSTSAN